MEKGIFITVEGLDGSGKTTQIELIKEFFTDKGIDVVLTREPGGTVISEKIRGILLDTENSAMGEITEMMLYASSRAQLVYEVIKPALNSGKVVVCDRFVDSSLAYQGFGRNINLDIIKKTNDIAVDGIVPDITFFLDVEPTVARGRIQPRKADRIEKEDMEFYNRVYEGYKTLANQYPDRIKVIEGNRLVKEIFKDISYFLNKLI